MPRKLSDQERAIEYASRKISLKNRATYNAVVDAVVYGMRFERDNGRGVGTAHLVRSAMVGAKATTAAEICERTGLPRDEVSTHLAMMATRKHAKRSGEKWTLTDVGMTLLMGVSTRRERKPAEARLRSINTMRKKEETAKSGAPATKRKSAKSKRK